MFIVLSSWPKSLHHCVVSDHFFKGVSPCVHSFPFPLVMVPQRHISSIVSSPHHVASHSRPHHRTAPVCVRSVIFLCNFARHGAVIRLQHRCANARPRHLVHMSCETYSLLPRGEGCVLSLCLCLSARISQNNVTMITSAHVRPTCWCAISATCQT